MFESGVLMSCRGRMRRLAVLAFIAVIACWFAAAQTEVPTGTFSGTSAFGVDNVPFTTTLKLKRADASVTGTLAYLSGAGSTEIYRLKGTLKNGTIKLAGQNKYGPVMLTGRVEGPFFVGVFNYKLGEQQLQQKLRLKRDISLDLEQRPSA